MTPYLVYRLCNRREAEILIRLIGANKGLKTSRQFLVEIKKKGNFKKNKQKVSRK